MPQPLKQIVLAGLENQYIEAMERSKRRYASAATIRNDHHYYGTARLADYQELMQQARQWRQLANVRRAAYDKTKHNTSW